MQPLPANSVVCARRMNWSEPALMYIIPTIGGISGSWWYTYCLTCVSSFFLKKKVLNLVEHDNLGFLHFCSDVFIPHSHWEHYPIFQTIQEGINLKIFDVTFSRTYDQTHNIYIYRIRNSEMTVFRRIVHIMILIQKIAMLDEKIKYSRACFGIEKWVLKPSLSLGC